MAGSIPALAAEVAPRQDASYYPISVEEYTYGELEEPRINKVYQLALSDDPSLIPTEDFERDGCWFTLLDKMCIRDRYFALLILPYLEIRFRL